MYRQHGRPVVRKAVAGAGLNEAFQGFFVYLGYVKIINKSEYIPRCTFFFSGFYDGVNSSFAHIFDSQKSEADFAVFNTEFLAACTY